MLDDVAAYLVLAPLAAVAGSVALLLAWRAVTPRVAAARRRSRRQSLA